MPVHDQRRYEGDEAEDLIHRHRSTGRETDKANEDWQAELTTAQTDQAADATDQQGARKSDRRHPPAGKCGHTGRRNRGAH
jgi:hypothetical protein